MFSISPGTKLLKVDEAAVRTDGTLIIDAVRDVYNEARSWEASAEGIVFDEVVAGTGGVVLPSGIRTEIHVVLNDGWRIEPPENALSVEVVGNLHRHDDSDPIGPTASGKVLPVRQTNRQGRAQRIFLHYTAIALVSLGLIVLALWAWFEPNEFEPYATFSVVAATLVQLIRNGRPI